MANTIQLKRSSTTGHTPTLAAGEIAINDADQLLFWKDSGGTVRSMHLREGSGNGFDADTVDGVHAAALAPLASPALTGNPTAPTPAVDDNDTSIATTAFVLGQASASGDGTPAMDGTAARGSSTHFARADHVHPTDTSRAPLASPSFTGTPAAPTASAGTNTTQIATTAFTVAEIAARIASSDAMLYKGVQDCSANPNYPAADAGWTYKVSVAGKIGGASGPNVEAGDLLICNVDSTASGNHATVGANWDIIQVNIDGAVVGPSSSVTARIATFNGTGGKTIQDGGNTIAEVLARANHTGTQAASTITGLAAVATSGAKADVGLGNVPNYPEATAAEIQAGTASKLITAANINLAAAWVALTDGATVTPAGDNGFNLTLAIGGNRTLANMTTPQVGRTYIIEITQDGTGSRTLAYGSAYKFPGGAPALSTAAGAVDVLTVVVKSSSVYRCSLAKAFA